MKMEFWVMRVLLHQGRTVQLNLLTPTSRAEVQVQLDAGRLAQLPDGAIAEPVEVFEEEEKAHLYREVMRAKHPSEDFRVIMNGEAPL